MYRENYYYYYYVVMKPCAIIVISNNVNIAYHTSLKGCAMHMMKPCFCSSAFLHFKGICFHFQANPIFNFLPAQHKVWQSIV